MSPTFGGSIRSAFYFGRDNWLRYYGMKLEENNDDEEGDDDGVLSQESH